MNENTEACTYSIISCLLTRICCNEVVFLMQNERTAGDGLSMISRTMPAGKDTTMSPVNLTRHLQVTQVNVKFLLIVTLLDVIKHKNCTASYVTCSNEMSRMSKKKKKLALVTPLERRCINLFQRCKNLWTYLTHSQSY